MKRSLRGSSALVLGVAIGFTSCNRMAGPPPLEGDHSFSLVYSQSNFGNIEPCACNNRTTGGFPRRFAYLEAQREAGRPLLILDSGDSLFTEQHIPAEMEPQARAKASAIARAFVTCGTDAMTFGDLDLRQGGNFLKSLVEKHDLPMVAANVKVRKTGDPLFEPYRIIDRDGVKIAVIGLVAPEVRRIVSTTNEEGATMTTLSKEQHVLLEELFDDRDVLIEDPIEVARDVVAEVRGEAHMVIVLSHMTPRMTKEFAASVEGVDMIVGGHMPTNRVSYGFQAGVLTMTTPMNGTAIGIVDFSMKNGQIVCTDRTEIEGLRDGLPAMEELKEKIVAQYGTEDPDVIQPIDVVTANDLRMLNATLPSIKSEIDKADAGPGSFFIHSDLTLDGKEYPDHPAMSEQVREYRRGLADLYTSDAEPDPAILPATGTQAFVKDSECIQCHKPQYEFWQRTNHSHAWKTMLDYDAQFDLECITCHTVGYMKPGGFDRPDRVGGHENVQCENCHGPGSFHLDGVSFLDRSKIVGAAIRMKCEECHNNEHSPEFQRETYVSRASCPPMDHNEPLIRGALGLARQGVELSLRKDGAKPSFYQAAIEIDLRLGNYQQALDLALEALKKFPARKKLAIGAAWAFDGLGRTGEAIDMLAGTYDEAAPDPAVLEELARLFLHGNDIAARDLGSARAAIEHAISTFAGKEPVWILLFAELLYAEGQIDDAITEVQRVVETMNMRTSPYTDRLEAWTAEKLARTEYLLPAPMPAAGG